MQRLRILVVVAAMTTAIAWLNAARTITGRVTAVTETSITVKDKREVTVNIDGRTRYTRWVKRKPWQQDVRLTVRALRVGRFVAVHLRDETSDAAWIQIDVDGR